MPSIYQLKSKFQGLLRPLVTTLAAKRITANQVTVAAMILSVLMGAVLFIFHDSRWPWLLLPAFLFLRMALNAIDGMLARDHGMKSRLGAILNELGDVVSDCALYLPFALLAGAYGWLVTIICILAVISEMAGIIGVQIGATRRYDGPMGKSDRAFVFGTIGFIIGIGIAPGMWLTIGFAVILLLVAATVVNRASKALKEGPHA